MKKMICDICGSSEILKHENVFLCKSCGCMYSLEEAKKLLRNIPDEEKVPNIIKPGDSSRDHVEKLRSLARRAKKQNDARSGADYYRQLLTEDPQILRYDPADIGTDTQLSRKPRTRVHTKCG